MTFVLIDAMRHGDNNGAGNGQWSFGPLFPKEGRKEESDYYGSRGGRISVALRRKPGVASQLAKAVTLDHAL